MLGYGSTQKGYRLYDVERMKVVHSRDVVFDETSTPGLQKETTVKYVELEVDGDDASYNESQVDGESNEPDQVNESTMPSSEEDSAPRRSTRNRQAPDRYGHVVTMVSCDQEDPTSVAEAKASRDKYQWEKAMNAEMASLQANNVWELVNSPTNRKVIGSKWIFKRKLNADGVVERYKARLVAQGCSQKYGLDYEETFSPVVRFESVRMLLAIRARHKLELHQMDVATAFLHGELTEEVYMQQPEGFVESGKENMVCRLKRSIYGLKQSPHCWNHALAGHLKEIGFSQTPSDPCIYVRTDTEGEILIVAVYVDDIILACNSPAKMNVVKEQLSQKFEMKDLGALHHFLGVKIVQDMSAGTVWAGQPFYIEKILRNFGMHDSKPVASPVNPGTKLTACKCCEQCCSLLCKPNQ